MAYFNPVTKLEERVTTTIIKDGQSVQVQANVYRCMGIQGEGSSQCRLCWTTFDMAKFCAMRGHKESWVQMYGETGYKRVALRRDPVPQAPNAGHSVSSRNSEAVQAQAQVPAPAPSAAAPPPSPTLEDVKAMALVLGYRLSRIPAKPVSEVQELEPAF